MSIRLAGAILLLFGMASAGFSQDSWTKVDEQYLVRFKANRGRVEQHVMAGEWPFAENGLRDLKWFLDKWDERGHSARPEVVEARAAYESLASRVASKSAIDPNAEKTVRYVRREGGKAKGGGRRDLPAKFFWRELEQCKPGDEIRVSGPILGWRKSGKISIEIPHLTIRGGYDAGFSLRDTKQNPTVMSRPEGSEAVDRARVMMKISRGDGVVLDGLVFDHAGHNVYGAGGGDIDAGRSRVSPTLSVSFTGKVVIRNCVFLNASFGAVLLAASGKGEAVVENCIFINCVGPALKVRGEGARFLVRNNTFALIHPKSSTAGTCIELGSGGTLVAEGNVFAYADYAVTALLDNLDMTLNRNVQHALSGEFLLFAQGGRTSRAGIEDLEEVDLEEAEENVVRDPDLPLDPTSLLKYLRSTMRSGLDEELIAREVTRAEVRLETDGGAEAGEGGGATDPGKDEEDPFQDDPFADPPPDGTEGGKTEEPGGGGPVPAGPHYAPAYPENRGVISPRDPNCSAGARPLREEK